MPAPKRLSQLYAGAGPNICYTALSSAKQKSATAHCYRAFQRNPCKGSVTNITACTCVSETIGCMSPSATFSLLKIKSKGESCRPQRPPYFIG
jgi:hypothetical protein